MTMYKVEFDDKEDYYSFLNSRISFWTIKAKESLNYLDHPSGILIKYFQPAKKAFQKLEKYILFLEEFEKEEKNEENG